jgi:hypothetical protein
MFTVNSIVIQIKGQSIDLSIFYNPELGKCRYFQANPPVQTKVYHYCFTGHYNLQFTKDKPACCAHFLSCSCKKIFVPRISWGKNSFISKVYYNRILKIFYVFQYFISYLIVRHFSLRAVIVDC